MESHFERIKVFKHCKVEIKPVQKKIYCIFNNVFSLFLKQQQCCCHRSANIFLNLALSIQQINNASFKKMYFNVMYVNFLFTVLTLVVKTKSLQYGVRLVTD